MITEAHINGNYNTVRNDTSNCISIKPILSPVIAIVNTSLNLYKYTTQVIKNQITIP